MERITNIIIFTLCFLVIYTGSGFVEISFNCSKCASTNSLYEKLFPIVKTAKNQGKCTCGCNSAGSCSTGGGCSCGTKKALAKKTDAKKKNTEKDTEQQSRDCAKHIFNKFDLQTKTVSTLIPQQLVVPAFFDYNPLNYINLSMEDNMMFETYNKGPIPPLLSRFMLNLYCTLLI